MTDTTTPAHVRKALEKVLGYSWSDERDSYYETPKTERRNHIYKEMCILRQWLYRSQKS